jgi:hypothetical protein
VASVVLAATRPQSLPSPESENQLRKIQMIGTALIAVCAMTAILASAAEAAPAHFEWPAGTVKIKRVANTAQEFSFKLKSGVSIGAWYCNTLVAEATVSAHEAPSFLTTKGALHYEQSGEVDTCPGSPFGSWQFKMNECQYQFVAGTSTGVGKSVGTMNIVCPTGKAIEMNLSSYCSIKILPGEGLGPVNYSTVTPELVPQVVAELAMKDVKFESSTPSGCGNHTGEAEFTGKVTFGGFTSAGAANSLKVVP